MINPINKYTDPIELEIALLISVITFSLALGNTIIGVTATSNTITVPIKVGQSIIFSRFNYVPPQNCCFDKN